MHKAYEDGVIYYAFMPDNEQAYFRQDDPFEIHRDAYTVSSVLDNSERSIIRQAMDAWEKVCGVRFEEVPWAPQMQSNGYPTNYTDWDSIELAILDVTSDHGYGYTGLTDVLPTAITLAIHETAIDRFDDPDFYYDIALHEIGHAIGIGHLPTRGNVMSGNRIDLTTEDPSPGNTGYDLLRRPGRAELTDADKQAARDIWGPATDVNPALPVPAPADRGDVAHVTAAESLSDLVARLIDCRRGWEQALVRGVAAHLTSMRETARQTAYGTNKDLGDQPNNPVVKHGMVRAIDTDPVKAARKLLREAQNDPLAARGLLQDLDLTGVGPVEYWGPEDSAGVPMRSAPVGLAQRCRSVGRDPFGLINSGDTQ